MDFTGAYEFVLLPYRADRGPCHYTFDGAQCHLCWSEPHGDAPGVLGSSRGTYAYDGATLRARMVRAHGHGPSRHDDTIHLDANQLQRLRSGEAVDVRFDHEADGALVQGLAARVWARGRPRPVDAIPSVTAHPSLMLVAAAAPAFQQAFVWDLGRAQWPNAAVPATTIDWTGSVPDGVVKAIRHGSSCCSSTLRADRAQPRAFYVAGAHCHDAATWTMTATAFGCDTQVAQLSLTAGQTVTVSYGLPDVRVPQINYYYSIDGGPRVILGVATFGTTNV
ncbi:MAG: hypothetical protein H6709_01725 [Kofleriaceae bacterium]|nr:hypothetical protein [Myxococcales bacterium]MCB9570788.1 hypothetical protein [Kofleriaceae bacterium]